jgi:predicted ATPase/DNA-binding CsgD family transcriptional regulator
VSGGEPGRPGAVPAEVPGLAAGSRVAGYLLEEQVGAGGMAVVFRARDERLGRLVALKVLAPALAQDAVFRERFIRESRAAAAVDDPHIIPVFEAGEAGGVLFIAMRYVPGSDVHTLLQREGPLPAGRAAAIVSAVASALDAAHAAGLVHRDVKPANMLIDTGAGRPDHVYLSDFGLSKMALAASTELTGAGHFLGTLDYISPEQLQARPVDGRTDQYGLACTAFELLAGSPPFQGDQGAAVMSAHLSEPPPPLASRRPDIPPAADRVLARAMAKAPTDRYACCREFAEALRAALGLPHYAQVAGDGGGQAAGGVGLPDPGARHAGPGMTRLAETILAVPDAAAGGMHGFAPALSSFVGRADAVADVAGLLDGSRLVTVTGPGGVGKTRLAGEVAQRVAGEFADGVWLAELAAVREPGQVPAAVAAAVGARHAPGLSVTASLAAALARRQLLLVLDNCEHVATAAAELCAALLPAADDLKVLATSQEPLRIAGEARYRLQPLTLPDPGGLAEAGGSEAVALFANRARLADPQVTLDGEAGPVVAQIVARLDGIPLAIELAAARVEALGVTQLLERLDDRFAMLASGDRLAPPRHRSLAATVDWSCRLLGEREQKVFRQASAFPAAFTLQGAEAVAGADAGPLLLHLVDCSLLTPPRPGPDGRARYLMLETLRAYGADRLAEAGEQAGATAALARYALQVAEQAAAGMQLSGGELAAARWLDAEDPLVHQGLTWALDHDRPAALRLATALAPWWRLRGRLAAGYALMNRAVEHATPGGEAWCAAQFWLGELAHGTSDFATALGHFTAARDTLAAGGPSPLLADVLAGGSGALLNQDRVPEAAGQARRALAMARECGYPSAEVRALTELAWCGNYSGDAEDSLKWALRAQQVDTARISDWAAREVRVVLTAALTEAGQPDPAAQTCAELLSRARDAGHLQDLADGLWLMAEIGRQTGRISDAGLHLRESLEVAARTGDRLRMIDCLDTCGHLCVATGRWAEAITLWAAHAAHSARIGMPDLPQFAGRRQESMRKARQALRPAATAAAEQRGTAMTLATAAEYAALLAAPGSPQPQPPPGLGKLSPRERELVILVAQGATDAQIAERLYISVRTVRSHLDRIRDKTGCRRRADLTRLALQAGLV